MGTVASELAATPKRAPSGIGTELPALSTLWTGAGLADAVAVATSVSLAVAVGLAGEVAAGGVRVSAFSPPSDSTTGRRAFPPHADSNPRARTKTSALRFISGERTSRHTGKPGRPGRHGSRTGTAAHYGSTARGSRTSCFAACG